MKLLKKIILLSILFMFGCFFILNAKSASAITFEEIITGAKSFFTGGVKKELTITSDISLTPEGDLNKNGVIDAGDKVRFLYAITNTTNNAYKTITLNTNINTKELNTFNDVQGVLSLDTVKNTIIIPHLTIKPNQVRTISFVARVNFNKEEDQSITTEAELVDENNSSLFKGQKKEINAKKMDADNFNKFVHISK